MAATVIATIVATSMLASFYWQGTQTASGERFDPDGMTAAHRTLPFGTLLKVCYRGCVAVRVTDRGPWNRKYPAEIDLSRGAARAIGMEHLGIAHVTVTPQ